MTAPEARFRWWLPALGLLGVLLALLLTANFHLARFASRVNASQAVARGNTGGPSASSDGLQVYIADGFGPVAPALQAALSTALLEAEVTVGEITFLSELPDAIAGPILLLWPGEEAGLWTPLYATRQVKATMEYLHGATVSDGAQLANRLSEERPIILSDQLCSGPCSIGRREVELSVTGLGLISLPSLRRYTAQQLAKEAAILVRDGGPEHLDPSRWFGRAQELATEQRSDLNGAFGSFQRVEGCRGGLLYLNDRRETVAARYGPDHPGFPAWAIYYYNAEQDRLTAAITDDQVFPALQERPGFEDIRPPLSGWVGWDGEALLVPAGRMPTGLEIRIRVPVKGCTLGAWQLDVTN